MNKPFWRIRIPLRCALVLLFGFLPEAAGQQSEGGDQQECRAGFDVGSSGIRLGSNSGEADNAESRPINYLADLNENNDQFKITTIDKTVGWFQVLRAETELPSDCKTVAGGFSAWRRAVQDGDPGEVADVLADIHHRTGVPLYVIPLEEEGKYGYRAAQAALDEQLTTQAIWDIGGGSMQIAQEDAAWGSALGQREWRRLFCATIKHDPRPDCAPNPVGDEALGSATEVLAGHVEAARDTLGVRFTVTAISPPIVRTMHPILKCLTRDHITGGSVDETGFDREALAQAIDRLAPSNDEGIRQILNDCDEVGSDFISTAVTDMLLVHAFMEGLAIDRLEVAVVKINNVAGLIADDLAFAWAKEYDCYLERLREQGVNAYRSDPATCPN